MKGGRGADALVLVDTDRSPKVADPGTAHIKDFDTTGRAHDILDLSHSATSWVARDAACDDGFPMLQSDGNVDLCLQGLSVRSAESLWNTTGLQL